MANLSREEIVKMLEPLVSRLADRKVSLTESMAIYQDLSIDGDDAAELIQEIRTKFGTRFDGFDYEMFFPNETEAFGAHLARLFGFSNMKRKRLSVGHLIDVIQKGAWFDPLPPEKPETS